MTCAIICGILGLGIFALGSADAFRPWGVRYQVTDIERSIAFYTQVLGFTLELKAGTAFAQVSNAHLKLLLSGPGSSGARPMPDGREQTSGGWNRIVLQVNDLPAHVEELRRAGVTFRNQIETGPGGSQIQIEDPDGNPIEFFEPGAKPGGTPDKDQTRT